MTRGRRLAGFALLLALGPIGAATGAPQITTEGGTPLPDPFQRAKPAAADPADADPAVSDPAVSAAYKATVFQRLAAAVHVGETLKGVPGAAGIHFAVGGDGALLQTQVKRSSGDPTFDANALAMVREAAPFPPPPSGARRDFDVTIRFQAGHKP